jgi:Signal transduction histidine kinase
MSIRTKLVLSYIAMLVIPVVLSIGAAVFLSRFYLGGITNAYSLNLNHNSLEEFNQQLTAVSNEINRTAANNPDQLSDGNYLRLLDQQTSRLSTGIIVKKNDQVIYASKNLDNSQILANMQFETGQHNPKPIFAGNRIFLMRQSDFNFTDKSRGNVYLLTDVSPLGSFVRRFIPSQLLAVLLILIFTNAFLTYLVSRNIIKPIRSLKDAAQQIKEGNLDFSVRSHSNDEIGQLCQAFEEMRSRLKESIDLQMQYEDNRKELIANISHDLKTPVASVKGYVAGIMDGVADSPEKLQKYIRTIDRKVSDIDKLIDELFLFSKLDLQKEPFNFEKVEIKEYLQDCTEELKLDLVKQGIILNYAQENSEPLWVIADREKLKRVIHNIVDNAAKYRDQRDSTINFTLEETNNEFVTMQIGDNGRGIPEEALAYIFERFYRVDPSRSAVGGSGIGLAVAKQIIAAHGGKIWAESKEGQGTSIYFTLKKVKDS